MRTAAAADLSTSAGPRRGAECSSSSGRRDRGGACWSNRTARRRLGVGLQEQSIGTSGHRRAYERPDVLRLASAHARALPGSLHGMRAVEDGGCVARLPQPLERAHVHHQVAVPEEGAALGDRHAGAPAERSFSAAPRISCGAIHCPFLTFTARPCGLRQKEVRLAAQEGGDLQHVDDLRGRRALRALVHVREHGQARRLADTRELPQPLLQPRARGGSRARSGSPCRTRP